MEQGLMAWVILTICVLIEVVAAMLLARSEGFTKLWLGISSLVLFGVCFAGLSFVVTRIPVGIAYAVWAGAGVALVCVAGWLYLRQPLSAAQLVFIALIAIGAVGLNLTTEPS
jgi:multidrug transporter EmrE-like cation transporter